LIAGEMGPAAGTISGIGILLICIIILAVLNLVVVKALIVRLSV
jgi:carbon starvation protein